MSKVSEFLTENPVQYLAAVSLDGKAKCRPCKPQDTNRCSSDTDGYSPNGRKYFRPGITVSQGIPFCIAMSSHEKGEPS